MNQTRLFLKTDKQQAQRIAALFEAAFEEDALPLALAEDEEHPESWIVSLYVETVAVLKYKTRLRDILDSDTAKVTIQREDLGDIDWVSETLRELEPVRAGRFIVHGSHDRLVPRANEFAIEINAGQAFGTGHHGTTAGCLDMLYLCLKKLSYINALDLGTGSGVLAIALAKATSAAILASDIDPIAVKVARENFRINGCANRIRTIVSRGLGHRIFADRGPYDLIIANILAGPLQKMSASICSELASGGTLILSGLLPHQSARIIAVYRNQGLALSRRHFRDGWLTLVMTAKNL